MMTLNELEKSDGSSVWIYNKSNPKGIITFLGDSGLGDKSLVTVPITWIPVDLSTQSTKKSLLSNAQFRRLVSGGMLELVSDKEAESILSTPEGQDENMRVFQLAAVGNAVNNIPQELKPNLEINGVSGYILSIANDKDMNYKDAIADIRRKADTLTKADYEYLENNAVSQELRDWAKNTKSIGR